MWSGSWVWEGSPKWWAIKVERVVGRRTVTIEMMVLGGKVGRRGDSILCIVLVEFI